MNHDQAAEPRHIAIFLPSLRGGGAERVMVTLANGFAGRGHRVDLVLARAEGPYLTEVGSGVRVVDLDRGRVLASLLPLARYLRRERPEAMLSAMNHANIIAILARKLARVRMRLVVSERSSPSGRGNRRMEKVIHFLMRRLYPVADGIVAVSQGVALELTDNFGLPHDKVVAIPNPVDLDAIAAKAVEAPGHPWLEDNRIKVILAVGRLVPEKDYPTLLRALLHVRQRIDARLVILGEGPLRQKLEGLVADQGLTDAVLMPGFNPNPFAWMAACDVYALSSVTEGFPNSLVQAMACGAPVVSTDCKSGPREILENGKWGLLVPIRDPHALAKSILRFLNDEDSVDTWRQANSYSMERIIDLYTNTLS